MKVDITGRHIEITEPLRKFATDRVERLHTVGDEIQEVHFIFTVEKHQRHVVEAKVKTKHDLHVGQLSGRMGAHAIGDHEQMPAPPPRVGVGGQHNGVGVLIAGAAHSQVAMHRMLERVAPVGFGFHQSACRQ